MNLIEIIFILSFYTIFILAIVYWFFGSQMSKFKINKINEFISKKEKELNQNYTIKQSQTEEASINLNMDLRRYQQLRNELNRFYDEVRMRNQEIEQFVKKQEKLVGEGHVQTKNFNQKVLEMQQLYERFKQWEHEVVTREERAKQVIERIIEFEDNFEQKLNQKITGVTLQYDELMNNRKNSLNKLSSELEAKLQSSIDQFGIGENKYTNLVQERFKEIEVELKDKMDHIIDFEKNRLQQEVTLLSEETKDKLYTFSADLDKGELRQKELFDQKRELEKNLEDYKESLKGRIDDLAEVILTGFKEKVDDYQLEIINSLQDKFNALDGTMQEWDNHLSQKEKEIINDIDIKFQNINESFVSFKDTVEEEVNKLSANQSNLKNEFIKVHEDQLEKMMIRIEDFKGQITELEEKSNSKGFMMENLTDLVEEAKQTVEHKLMLFSDYIEKQKRDKKSLFQKNQSLINDAYQELSEKVYNSVKDFDEMEVKLKSVENLWKEKIQEVYQSIQIKLTEEIEESQEKHRNKLERWLEEVEQNYQKRDKKLAETMNQFDKIKIDFKEMASTNQRTQEKLNDKLSEEEHAQLSRSNQISQLQEDQENIFLKLTQFETKVDESLAQVNLVEDNWKRLDQVLQEIEEKHLTSVEENLKVLEERSEDEFNRFVQKLDKLVQTGQNSINRPYEPGSSESKKVTSSPSVIEQTTFSPINKEEYQIKLDKQIVELQNQFYQKFDSFLDELNDEKNLQNGRINKIVNDFQKLVESKENQIGTLDQFNQDSFDILEKKKKDFIERSENFYQVLEQNTGDKFNVLIKKIEKKLSQQFEVKRQDLEDLISDFLEEQKSNLKEYEWVVKSELEDIFKDKLNELEDKSHQVYEKISEDINRSLSGEKEYLISEIENLENRFTSKKKLFHDMESLAGNLRNNEQAQQEQIRSMENLIKVNQEKFKDHFQDTGMAKHFFEELKKEFSTNFLKKQLGTEFEQYQKDLTLYTEKWEKLYQEMEDRNQKLENVVNDGKFEVEEMIKKSKIKLEDQEKYLTEKFNETIDLIDNEMLDIGRQINSLLEKSDNIDKMYEFQSNFEQSYTKFQKNLSQLDSNREDISRLQKDVSDLREKEKQLNDLHISIEQKEVAANEVEKKLIKILELSNQTEGQLKNINSTFESLGDIQLSMENFKEEIGSLQSKINDMSEFKDKFQNIKEMIESLETEAEKSQTRGNILIEKIENEEEQQQKIKEQLKGLEDKSILLENQYKIIDEFTDRFDQLDIAILDIEKRLEVVSNLKKELASEKNDLQSIKEVFDHQIGVSLNLLKGEDKELTDKYPQIVLALKNIGWKEKQIAQHLKLELSQVKKFLARNS